MIDRKIIFNEVLKNNNGDEFIVVEKVNIKTKAHTTYYKVLFLNTQINDIFSKEHILSGKIRDKYSKNPLDGSYVGNIKNASKHFLYNRWRGMLSRCYNHKESPYKYYGEKGITVCDRWLCFEYYIEDVVLIEGYNENDVKKNLLQLDKDIINRDAKIYSPETCIWVNHKDNRREAVIRNNDYILATNIKTNEVIKTKDWIFLTEYCKVNKYFIYDRLRNKKRTMGEWDFERV